MRFRDPQLLLLLAFLAPLFLCIRRSEGRRPAFPLSAAFAGDPLPETLRSRLARLLPYLRLAVLALGIVALARPQAVQRESQVQSRGMDLVLALDLSTSMLAEEQGHEGRGENRLATAKRVLAQFIRGRKNDRIGLVAFAGRPYPAAPLTSDHQWLQGIVERLDTASVEDGTALGDAILAGVNRLRQRPAESRALILITDGRNNAGAAPQLAAQAAKALGIRVHAIGIGSRGSAVIPVPSPFGGTVYRRLDAELDAATLKGVAETTGGRYFEAGDATVLSGVFAEIDRLERTPVKEKIFFSYEEEFRPLLAAALLLFLTELLLRYGWLRRAC